MEVAFDTLKLVLEPGGAVALAAALDRRVHASGGSGDGRHDFGNSDDSSNRAPSAPHSARTATSTPTRGSVQTGSATCSGSGVLSPQPPVIAVVASGGNVAWDKFAAVLSAKTTAADSNV